MRVPIFVVLIACGTNTNQPNQGNLDVQLEVDGEGKITFGSVTCPPNCLVHPSSSDASFTLVAEATDPTFAFSEWIDIPGTEAPGRCAPNGAVATPTLTVHIDPAALNTGNISVPFQYGCRAIFVPKNVAQGDVRSRRITNTGDSIIDYRNSDGERVWVVDGTGASEVVIVPLDEATPARDVALPGVFPAATAPSGGHIVIGGSGQGGVFLGGLAPDSTFTWQGTLTGKLREIDTMNARDATHVLFAGAQDINGLYVATADAATGAITSVTGVDAIGFPSEVMPLGTGWGLTASQFLGSDRNSTVLRADANDALVWHLQLTGGFVEVAGMSDSGDGGAYVFGRHGATGGTALPWVARLGANGSPLWQFTFGTETGDVKAVIPTAAGARIGVSGGGHAAVVLDIDGNGALQAGHSYDDTEGHLGFVMGFAAEGNAIAIGASSISAGTVTAIDTADDGSIAGCADTTLGASVDVASFAAAADTVAFADVAITATTLAPFTSTPTSVAPAATTITDSTDLCTN